jgi:hypothetical protein
MAFSNTDTFLRTTLDAIGALAQKEESLREINLRLSISRQDISWRINAADDYAHDFQRLSTTPVTEGRYYQETKALFGFFTSALSALECFFYAAYFVGNAAVDPTKITPSTVRAKFSRFRSRDFFKEHFSNDAFTQSLITLIGLDEKGANKIAPDKEHQEIRDIRDTLSHRATPGRIMRLIPVNPFTWLLSDLISGATNQVLDKDFLLSRQGWLQDTIHRLCTELDDFWTRNCSVT